MSSNPITAFFELSCQQKNKQKPSNTTTDTDSEVDLSGLIEQLFSRSVFGPPHLILHGLVDLVHQPREGPTVDGFCQGVSRIDRVVYRKWAEHLHSGTEQHITYFHACVK